MPSVSEKQRRLMAIAEHNPSQVFSKNRGVLKMSHGQLHDYASSLQTARAKHKKSLGG